MGCVAHTTNQSHKLEVQQNRASNISASKKPKQKLQAIDNRLKTPEISDAPTAIIESRKKTSKDITQIQTALKKLFIFNTLSPEQISQLINEMKLYTLSANSTIFEQNSTGNNFFIISSGRVEVQTNAQKKTVLKPGDSFGELALLHGTLRAASTKALESTSLWSIDRKTFRNVAYSVNNLNYKENKTFLDNVGIFQVLTENQKEQLLNSFNTQTFAPGTFIVNDGDPGELFFIVKEGKVVVVKDGIEIRELGKGDYFGEQALLYKQNRTASIQTLSTVVCLSIAETDLVQALGSQLQQIIYKNSLKIALEQDLFMKKLNKTQIDALSEAIKVYSYKSSQIVATAGTNKGFNLFVVVKGELKCKNRVFSLFSCGFSQEFCENSQEPLEEDLTAIEDSDIGLLSIEHFEKLIGGKYSEVSLFNEILSTLRMIPLLTSMSAEVLKTIVRVMKTFVYQPQTVIFEENEPGDSFFIIRSGEVNVCKSDKWIRKLSKFDVFGERSLLFNTPRTATVTAITAVELWSLQRNDFFGIFPEPFKSQLLKRIEIQDSKVQLQDLCPIKLIGKGMFGNVFLVTHKKRKTCYALKTISRTKINSYSLHSNIIHERKIVFLLDHNMIMKLVKTFKDVHRIYFLLEHVAGVDMFDVLRTMEVLSESDSKFYAACLITVLEHIHSKGIVYRDLKPENLVVDSEGYPKMIDFGISKIISGRTFSLVGTPHYMPPEVIEGKGYGVTADYWSLGVMVFEFLCGNLPFGDEEEEPYAIYEKILERKLVFPSWIDYNSPCMKFVEQLLSSNPGLRIGGSCSLRSHPWLFGVNWEKLAIRQMKPPYMPRVQDLNEEIEESLKMSFDLNEIITAEEQKDYVKVLNLKSEENENWDYEF